MFNKLVERHYPDVSVGNSVAVVLKHKRAALGTLAVGDSAGSNVRKLYVVVNNDTVLNNGHSAVLCDLAVLVKLGSTEDDVVGLPLKSGKTSIEKRGMHLVDTGAVVVTGLLDTVGVKNLNLVAAVYVYTAVTLTLTGSLRHIGNSELYVNMCITELVVGNDVAVTNGEDTVLNLPVGNNTGTAGGPVVEI